MDAASTTPPRAPADHPAVRQIAMILQPLYSRIIRVREEQDAPVDAVPAPALPPEEPAFEVVDTAQVFAAIDDTAIKEPATVAEARALIANPEAALAETEMERQVAWLVAVADLRHRRANADPSGRTWA